MSKVSIQHFTVNAMDKAFTTEISDLGINLGGYLTLVSDHGTEAEFRFDHLLKDDENDVIAWVYKPTAEAIDANSRLIGWSVTVYND